MRCASGCLACPSDSALSCRRTAGSDRGIPESNGSAIPDQDMRGQCENCPHFSVDVRAWNRHLSFYTKELPERGGTWFGSVGKCTGSE